MTRRPGEFEPAPPLAAGPPEGPELAAAATDAASAGA